MTEIEELAPHQRRLAELVGKRPGGPARAITDSWLGALRENPAQTISGLQRQLDDHRAGAAQSQMLADLAMSMSEYHGMAEPVDPSAAAFCDHCGNTTGLEETNTMGTPDRPCHCHNMVTRPCKDVDSCCRRREERYPPSMDRVPGWITDAQARIMDADTSRMLAAAVGQAAAEFCLELTAAIEAEAELELAQPLLPGWTAGNQYGAYDTRGDYIPVNFNWSRWNWRHTIRGGAPMHRTIANQQLTPARIAATAAVNQARGAAVSAQQASSQGQPSPGGQVGQPPGGGQGAQAAVYGVPEGVHRGLEGGDVAQGQVPVMQRMQAPEGPARATPAARRRRGKKLVYSAGRKVVVTKHAQAQPDDSGWGSSGEGPGGGSSET